MSAPNLQPLPFVPGTLPALPAMDAGTIAGESTGAPAFGELLQQFLSESVAQQSRGQELLRSHLAGENVSQIEVMTALKKAELSLQLTMQIRNKLLEGFRELKQMQI